MSAPDFQTLMLPVLKALTAGEATPSSEVNPSAAATWLRTSDSAPAMALALERVGWSNAAFWMPSPGVSSGMTPASSSSSASSCRHSSVES